MSNLPKAVREHLYDGQSLWMLPGNDDVACAGARHHSPRPLFTNFVRLALREWWPEDYPYAAWVMAPDAALCGTCADNLTMLLRIYHAADGTPPWPVRREFGNDLRALAEQGWEWFAEHRPANPEDSATKR